MKAANFLCKNSPILFDSAAFLSHLAFELLLKALQLHKYDRFSAGHDLLSLSQNITYFSEDDIDFLKIINLWNLIRYPKDSKNNTREKTHKIGEILYYSDEIGDEDLEKAAGIFKKIWKKLETDKDLRNMIHEIHKNPHIKGDRILMEKKKEER